jgi:hypothetical protein
VDEGEAKDTNNSFRIVSTRLFGSIKKNRSGSFGGHNYRVKACNVGCLFKQRDFKIFVE